MRRLILLILLILCATSIARAQTDEALKQERDKWLLQKKQTEESHKSLQKSLADAEVELKKNLAEEIRLQDLVKNKKVYTEKALQQTNAAISELSVAQRLVSRKAAFFKCVRNDLKDKGSSNISRCKGFHPAKFTSADEKLIQEWTDTVSLSSSDLKSKGELLTSQIKLNQTIIESSKTRIGYSTTMLERLADSELAINAKEADRKIIRDNIKFTNCDANSPAISLEEQSPYAGAKFQGPFYGVPRDNQDGLGTCYANAAKNLLVGASQGKDVASFLDLALIYKGEEGLISSGLDAGHSCGVIEKMQEKGYCPQEFAPFETGEKNVLAESLMGGAQGSIYDQSIVVDLLQRFLAGKNALTNKNKFLSEQILRQAKAMVHNIKARPNVIIPLPIVRRAIPSQWKLIELAAIKSGRDKKFSQSEMLTDYKNEYRKFYPEYMRGVIEGQTRDQIFDSFQAKMKSFIDKYHLADQMKTWKVVFIEDTESDWSNPNLKKDIANSLSFMKAMSGKQGASDEDFLKFCDTNGGDSFEFLSSLQPLVLHLKNKNIDTDKLFDAQGNFKSAHDLMQLAVAPACLKPEKRKKPAGMLCETGYDTISNIKGSALNLAEQKRMLRERVVASLVQGYALGNTFGSHINTIVGMKFNPSSQECEFQIRESQTGSSFWQSEQQTFSRIKALTEVRRK